MHSTIYSTVNKSLHKYILLNLFLFNLIFILYLRYFITDCSNSYYEGLIIINKKQSSQQMASTTSQLLRDKNPSAIQKELVESVPSQANKGR